MILAVSGAIMIDFLQQFFSSPVMQESFLTVGISHASLAGLGLAIALSLPLLPTATAFCVGIALLLAALPKQRGISEDTGTGLLFAGSMALGIVLISQVSRNQVDLFGLLFGNILTVSESEWHWLLFIGCIILFAFITMAYGTVGLSVVMCVKLAGIVLTTGLMVLPATCAWLWGRSLISLWLLSMSFAIIGTFIGLLFSYNYDWPSGATIVLTLCIMFIMSWGAAWLTQRNR